MRRPTRTLTLTVAACVALGCTRAGGAADEGRGDEVLWRSIDRSDPAELRSYLATPGGAHAQEARELVRALAQKAATRFEASTRGIVEADLRPEAEPPDDAGVPALGVVPAILRGLRGPGPESLCVEVRGGAPAGGLGGPYGLGVKGYDRFALDELLQRALDRALERRWIEVGSSEACSPAYGAALVVTMTPVALDAHYDPGDFEVFGLDWTATVQRGAEAPVRIEGRAVPPASMPEPPEPDPQFVAHLRRKFPELGQEGFTRALRSFALRDAMIEALHRELARQLLGRLGLPTDVEGSATRRRRIAPDAPAEAPEPARLVLRPGRSARPLRGLGQGRP